MITYNRSAFGLNLIFRVHGSAVYRAVFPSLVSVMFFFIIRNWVSSEGNTIRDIFGDEVGHPYAIGALVGSASFLVVFRANQGYARYWEGASAVHHMMSKWMDATTHTSVYHMQCDHYNDIKPPSFFQYPELNHFFLSRDRERRGFVLRPNTNNDKNKNNNNNNDVISESPPSNIGTASGVVEKSRRMHRNESFQGTQSTGNPRTAANDPDSSSGLIKEDESEDPKLQPYHSGSEIYYTEEGSKHIPLTETLRRQSASGSSGAIDKTLLREEKYKRRRQAVVKSINKVETTTSGLHRRHKTKKFSQMPQIPSAQSIAGERRAQSMDDMVNLMEQHFNPLSSSFFETPSLEKKFIVTQSKPGTGKPFPLWGKPRLDGNWGALFTHNDGSPMATFYQPTRGDSGDITSSVSSFKSQLPPEGFASTQGGRTPPLFLQELAHLSSLMVAVALSTLRNDIDGAESPLAMYEPGSEWPTLDPDKDEWIQLTKGTIWGRLRAFLGMGRSPEEQTRYNAGRPLPVIGGVSDGEIRFLQMARGPYAKTQLCWNWLSEFIIREHLAGTLGKVGPPIISRIIQFLGDGMIYYNHARKIMFIPFPFVHAQLSVLFVLVLIPTIPFMIEQYTEQAWAGSILTFFTVLCLAGVNEVARELEHPFRNIPNELPLVTFQAQYNEALFTMFAGYHPDHYWDGDKVIHQHVEHSKRGAEHFSHGNRERDKNSVGCNRMNGESSNKDSSGNGTSSDELEALKAQVAQQAAMIEKLMANMNEEPKRMDPRVETKTVENIIDC